MTYEQIDSLPDTVVVNDPGHVGHHGIVHRGLKGIKSRIDNIIANAVDTVTNQVINGVKTFSSSPVVPTPTQANHAATKDYVDNFAPNVMTQINQKVPKTRKIDVSAPVSGGGALSADVTLSLVAGGITLSHLGTIAKSERIDFRHSGSTRKVGGGDYPEGIDILYPIKITSVKYLMGTGDASGTTTVELRKNGVAIAGTSGTASITPTEVTFDVNLAVGDNLSVYITAVGNTPGKRLSAFINGVKI